MRHFKGCSNEAKLTGVEARELPVTQRGHSLGGADTFPVVLIYGAVSV